MVQAMPGPARGITTVDQFAFYDAVTLPAFDGSSKEPAFFYGGPISISSDSDMRSSVSIDLGVGALAIIDAGGRPDTPFGTTDFDTLF